MEKAATIARNNFSLARNRAGDYPAMVTVTFRVSAPGQEKGEPMTTECEKRAEPPARKRMLPCLEHPERFVLPPNVGLWEMPHFGCDYPTGGCDCYCGIYCTARVYD
jgi:hypothetical protein